MAIPEQIPAALLVIAWNDPVVEAHGYAPTSALIEHCWCPILGPTCTLLYRRLGTLAANRAETSVDLAEMSACLGLGEGTGRNSIIVRSLARLELFDVAHWVGHRYAVRTAMPALPQRLLRRLPPSAQAVHRRITEAR
jgi:hypothetical protein